MNKSRGVQRRWPHVDGYKLIVATILSLATLFFLFVTIMPVAVFRNLENASWEFKTFATDHTPWAALCGLVLFLLCGWSLLRVVRGPQALARPRRRPARPSPKPDAALLPTVETQEQPSSELSQSEPLAAEESAATEAAQEKTTEPAPAG